MINFPFTAFVRYLMARNVPPPQIDRITIVLINFNKGDDLVANIGATHIHIVRAFMELQKEKIDRRKRVRTFISSTVASMEGEDVVTKRARLESVMIAVHTLGEISRSSR